jgi:glyoxylase-like metal-dependent hydrolase (beta-lactamase superfamily II)
MGDMLRPYRFDDIRLQPAHRTFSGEPSLEVNGTRLNLIEVGPAHTVGDCIVHVPDREVVYAGDILFVGVTPVAWAGPVSRIVAALERVLKLNARHIVPGHGQLATIADVRLQIAYWDWAQAELATLAKAGLPPQQACLQCMSSLSFKASPFAAWLAPERLFTSACTLYREWGMEGANLPGPLGTLNHFRIQAGLAPKMRTEQLASRVS